MFTGHTGSSAAGCRSGMIFVRVADRTTRHASTPVAFAAHHRSRLVLKMTPLAVEVKGFAQIGHPPVVAGGVAFAAAGIFRRFIFHQDAILIVYMVAGGAIVDAGRLVVGLVFKKGRAALGIVENAVVHDHHILLGKGRHTAENQPQADHQAEARFSLHLTALHLTVSFHAGFSITS
jgi:hypothetical protein